MSEQITPTSFVDVINLWAKPRVLAVEVDQAPGTVRQWKGRNSIDPVHFPAVVAAAAKWGHPQVTLPLLDSLYKARHAQQDAPAAPALDPAEFA